MKVRFILPATAMILLALNNPLQAQNKGGLGFRLAMHLPNWSIKGDDDNTFGPIDPQPYPGFQFYLVYETFEENGGVKGSVELGYTSRGFRSQNDLLGIGEEVKFQLHYLDLLLPVKQRFGKGAAKFCIVLSPYAAYAVDGSVVTKVNGKKDSTGYDFDEFSTKRFDFGVVLGAGLSFDMSSGNTLVADFRLNQGFINLNKGSDAKEVKIKNVGLTFGVTAFFGGN